MNITHRTERADARARSITPVYVSQPDPVEGTEEWLAAKMLNDPATQVRFNTQSQQGETRWDNMRREYLDAMDGEMTTGQVAKAAGKSHEPARRALLRLYKEGAVSRSGPMHLRIWCKLEGQSDG